MATIEVCGEKYSGLRLYRNEEILRKLYWEEDLHMAEMADVLECSHSTIRRWMGKHGIKTRSNTAHFEKECDMPVEEMARLYTEERLSSRKIASRCNVNADTVLNKLKDSRVEIRDRFTGRTPEELLDPIWLREQYEGEGRTMEEIADGISCSTSSVRYWIKKHDIGTRPRANEPRGGGTPYRWLRRLLSDEPWASISRRARKGAEGCELCGEDTNSENLVAHHIIPVFAGGTHAEELLMPLCESCHPTVEWYMGRICDRVISQIVEHES